MEREIKWWLASTPGWGAVKLRQLTECIGMEAQILEQMKGCASPEQYLQWIQNAWEQTPQAAAGGKLAIKPQDVRRLWEHRSQWEYCRKEYHRWREKGVRFVTISDLEYPKKLKEIYDPPYALYFRGTLPREDRRSAAVIGARACSGYGVKQSRRLARELAAQGVQIISGLAYGVDSEGHWGALESGCTGATYAVLGCGVDLCYPPEHEKLAQQILDNGGGLISEFPMGTQPHPGHFPMRNRIISGLSDCILVIEARKRSGSLITVDQALEQGREVFALPGRVGDSLSEGCLQLIRNGADLLLSSEDVLEYLFPMRGEREENNDTDKETDFFDRSIRQEKHLVYSCLDCVGKTVEEIMELTGLPLAQVRMQLLELLLEDQIVETVKGYYSVEL